MTFSSSILRDNAARADRVAQTIESLESQLSAARAELASIEAERQQLETLSGAGESAIAQAQNFLALATRADRADMIDAFWAAMDELRSTPAAIAVIAPAPQPSPEPDTDMEQPNPEPSPEPDMEQPSQDMEELKAEFFQGVEDAFARAIAPVRKDFAAMTPKQLRAEWDKTGRSREEVKQYGKVTLKQTWVDALNAIAQ